MNPRIIIVVLFAIRIAVCQDLETLYQLIDSGREEIYHFQFEKASEVFKMIQNEYPEYPHGYFYEAYIVALYYSQDKTNNLIDSLLQVTVKKSIEKAEKYHDMRQDDPEALYYKGVSHGVLGIYHVLNRNYLKGYIHGRRGKNFLEKAVKLDSTYYDAYLGLGIFHYYVDLLPGIIKIFASILGFHGDREQGMAEIELTANHGRFFNMEAKFTHATVQYFLEGDKWNSFQVFKDLQKKYPDNPALALMIGYHYRRSGQIQMALKYFNSISGHYEENLPQITVMKLYNLGVCYYRMNDFKQSEYYFNLLLDHSLRKSRYYQAALSYYKGILAGMRSDQELSLYYFNLIYEHKETQYWYYISRLYVTYPFNNVMQDFIVANNNVYIANLNEANQQVMDLINLLNRDKTLQRSHMFFLIKDLHSRLAYRQGNISKAQQIYISFIDDLDDFNDKFHRAWIYISYAKVLRELNDWEGSNKMLEKALVIDDEYTRLIIERERFILKNQQKQSKT